MNINNMSAKGGSASGGKTKHFSALFGLVLVLTLSFVGLTYRSAHAADEDTEQLCSEAECGANEEIEVEVQECTKDTWTCENWSSCSAEGKQTRTCAITDDCPGVDTPEPNKELPCTPPPPPCTEDTWTCGNWGSCSSGGKQTRTCTMTLDCESATTPSPAQEQSCTPPPPSCTRDTWACGDWGACSADGKQTRTCSKTYDCPFADTAKPSEENSCTAPTETININTSQNNQPTGGENTENTLAVQVLSAQQSEAEKNLEQELQNQKQELINSGTSAQDAEKIINKILVEKRAEQKIQIIRNISQSTYDLEIEKSNQDSNNDGVSDEVAISLGINPKLSSNAEETLTTVEQKLFRTDEQMINVRCSMNVAPGTKLSSKGFSILSACPLNRNYTLYVKDSAGNEAPLDTQSSSANHKVIFNVEKPFAAGEYYLQVRATSNDPALSSDLTKVTILDDAELNLTAPVIRKIENIPVEGTKDIKVMETSDGKIHVSGISDVSSVVIATFKSAIFNSALLADTQSGAFEITSGQALPPGPHTVTVFSTRSEDSVQSAPVNVTFTVERGRFAALTKSSPMVVYVGMIVLILAAIGTTTLIIVKRKKAVVEGMLPMPTNEPEIKPQDPQDQNMPSVETGETKPDETGKNTINK